MRHLIKDQLNTHIQSNEQKSRKATIDLCLKSVDEDKKQLELEKNYGNFKYT